MLGGPGIVEGHSQDIGGEKIAGELDPTEAQPQASSQGMGQVNYVALSVENTLNLVNEAFEEFLSGSQGPICHCSGIIIQ